MGGGSKSIQWIYKLPSYSKMCFLGFPAIIFLISTSDQRSYSLLLELKKVMFCFWIYLGCIFLFFFKEMIVLISFNHSKQCRFIMHHTWLCTHYSNAERICKNNCQTTNTALLFGSSKWLPNSFFKWKDGTFFLRKRSKGLG